MSQPISPSSPDFPCPSVRSSSHSFISRDEARRRYHRTNERESQTRDQLSSAMRERTTSPMSPTETLQKDKEIAELKRQLAEIQAQKEQQRQQLQTAETTIRQQQATIHNQSKAIENPRPGRDGPATPQRMHNRQHTGDMIQNQHGLVPAYGMQGQPFEHSQYQPMMSAYGPVPPTYANPAFQYPSTNGAEIFPSNSTGHTPQSAARKGTSQNSTHRTMERYQTSAPGTPTPYQQGPLASNMSFPYHWQSVFQNPSQFPFASSVTGSSRGNQQSISTRSVASPASIETNPYPETAIPPASFSTVNAPIMNHDIVIRAAFQKIFEMAEHYATEYAIKLETRGIFALPKDMKDRLLKAANQTIACAVLTDPATRSFMIGKILIQWIIEHILRFDIFSGLDSGADQIIQAAKTLVQGDAPVAVRRYHLNTVAQQTMKLCSRTEFADFVNYSSQQQANKLLDFLQPLFYQRAMAERDDLLMLLRESYKLAEMMFTRTDEFSFDFIRHDSPFDPSTMFNVDPYKRGTDADLMRAGLVVGLSATPIVRTRHSSEQGEVSIQVLLKSKVLLRKQQNGHR